MRIILFLFLIVSLLACTNYTAIPKDVIAKEKMETILWQLIQIDQYTNSLVVKDSTQNKALARMERYQKVFDLNKISEPEFKKSYKFYLSHPDIIKTVFDTITARASRSRGEVYKAMPGATTATPAKPATPIKPVVK
jgi:hypothetical protein